ncbi:hypothetical protein B0H63DRAFT_183712 [Podospora didyma]|uniref:Uncharacterized protein n=1 Tax=Podospora didyma TaxID=330526 RepID=A0AAE0NPV1_9PEZI|nr:hypothetical protein B0H63DRAFT_183712 [Podospora didyma]
MGAAYVVGDSSPFMKRVLVPFWVVRIAIMIFEIGVYGLVIGILARYNRKDRQYYTKTTVETAIAVAGVMIGIILLCLILDIVCIVKRARRTLSPRFFLIVNVIQTTIWVVLFILSMIGLSSPLGFIIAIVILLSFIGLLIYASVIFHRFRKGTIVAAYAPAPDNEIHNLQNTSYSAGYPSYPSHSHQPPQQQQQGVHGYEPSRHRDIEGYGDHQQPYLPQQPQKQQEQQQQQQQAPQEHQKTSYYEPQPYAQELPGRMA